MHIEKISYQKTFNLGNYSSERIGVDINLNEGDTTDEAMAQARALIDKYHSETLSLIDDKQRGIHEQVIPTPKEPLSKTEEMIRDMNTCKDLKILESYRLIASKNPELQAAYDLKHEQLLELQIK